MKKKIITIAVLIFCVLGMIVIGYNDCHYKRTGYIVHTVFNNYVVFVDNTGNEWNVFTDGQSFIDGQDVVAVMFDNYTPTHIKDDSVVDLKFIN